MISIYCYIVSIWRSWLTSNDIIRFLKPQVKPLKIGHAGTLDPFASGVLIVCIGKIIKKVSYGWRERISSKIKFEQGRILLIVLEKLQKKKYNQSTDENLLKVFGSYLGEINQIPPMFSALKKDGKRLYELARKGITVDRNQEKLTLRI